jgi:GINS complex subunit 1
VRSVVREVRALNNSVQTTLSRHGTPFDPAAHPEVACAILIEYVCMRRNKRCLLAYHRSRTEKIQEGLWKGVDVVGSGDAGTGTAGAAATGGMDVDGDGAREKDGENSLAPEEEEYARGYAELLAAYKGQWTDVDLTGSLEPPRDLFVDVRVLRDAGEIQTEYGYVDSEAELH